MGKVKRSTAQLDANTRFARINFGLAGDVSDLLPGIFADITIRGMELDNISVIPASALQKNGKIWAVGSDLTLTSLSPNIVHHNGQTIAVSGLNQTYNVVISKLPGAIDGAKVSIAETVNKGSENE